MTDSLYAQAQAIAHVLLELPPSARADALLQHCAGRLDLQHEVEWLLRAAEDEALDCVPDSILQAQRLVTDDQRVDAAASSRYRLIEQIGEGGMGVVWLAEREVAGVLQRVAFKRLHHSSRAQRTRLREEQRILATIDHPNVARLVDAGDDENGVPFLAMEYVDGLRIDHWCRQHQPDLRARIALFIKVCAAVSYAHQRLVIHRDIKPANILIDTSGEPRLLDFGIARLIDAEGAHSPTTRLMTPAYASPEQLEGKPLGTATDVWSLGLVLYELLTGLHPFGYLDTEQARSHAALTQDAPPPSQPRTLSTPTHSDSHSTPKALRIPADIDAIVLKALRRAPQQRYASVRELAEDLGNFLTERPVRARRGQWTYRLQRYVLRNRWPLGAGLALTLAGVTFTWHALNSAREARLQAQVARRTTDFLVSVFALSDPTQSDGTGFSARDVLDRGRDRVNQELADQPRVQAELLEALGKAYYGINEGRSGATLFDSAANLNLSAAINKPLAAARNLRAKSAAILASGGATDEAQATALRAFELTRMHAGDDPLAMADAYASVAIAHNEAGEDGAAVRAVHMALKLRESAHDSPTNLARSHTDLCHVLAGAGHYAEAQTHCERALALHASVGAERSNDYRVALRRLESTLAYRGQYERSLALARERLALTRELYGEDSSVLAIERVMMADRLGERGAFDEAEHLMELGLPVIRQRNGWHSSQYAKAIFMAGWLRALKGEFRDALPRLRESLVIQGDLVGPDDRGFLLVLKTALAQTLIESGQADTEARTLLESVLAERSKGDGSADDMAYARLPLAQWHAAHGEAAEAEVLLKQIDAVGDGVEQELHARAATTRSIILAAGGDLEGARDQSRIAYELMLEDRGADNPRTVRLAIAYAQALRAAGEKDVARGLERTYGPRLDRAYPADSAYRARHRFIE